MEHQDVNKQRPKPLRKLLQRKVLPKPGEGPSREEREAGFFNTHLIAKGYDEKGQPVRLRALVKGNKDPGYGATAKMLSESALCLALDGASLECGSGVLTPAACMGMTLVERLRRAGMVFHID